MNRQLSIILIGEVDCGKSTLIGRLLFDTRSISKEAEQELRQAKEPKFAHLLDSFQEERANDFTLDTTQAVIRHKKRQYLFIDAPGHKELIKNMLTASSYAEAAIVVIDAQKGLEEQTKRHLYILKFIGMDSVMVAINKMDAVCYKEVVFQKISREINSFLKQIQLNPISYVPVSAKEGEGLLKRSYKMLWYKAGCLIVSLDKFIARKQHYEFRFPVQDIYRINNETIIAGTIISGDIKLKDKLKASPFSEKLTIKGIRSFGKKFKLRAKSPESVGLVLNCAKGLERGYVLYKGAPPRFTKQFSAKIFCVKPVALKETFTFLCSTQEAKATILHINTSMETTNFSVIENSCGLKITDVAEITLCLDKPVTTEEFRDLPVLGRFLLLKNSEVHAMGITF
ncbi:MAG: GTP-binding protein [Candidatus Omnitrophota bacterium]|nr:GTP-binding protein [Candidatus Omnitrophota bacterium]